MSTVSSSLDSLLAVKRAEHRLTQQSGSLRVLLNADVDTQAQLQSMCSELETPLLGEGGLGQFMEGLITDALSEKLEQQTAHRPVAHKTSVDDKLHRQLKQGLHQQPVAEARRRLMPTSRTSVEDTHRPHRGRSPDSPGETKSIRLKPAGIQVNQTYQGELQSNTAETREHRPGRPHPVPDLSPVTDQTRADEARTDERHGQRDQDHFQTPKRRNDNSKAQSASSAEAQIDALQASDIMVQRVTKAGLISAWNSPLRSSPAGQTEPSDETRSASEVEATVPGVERDRTANNDLQSKNRQRSDSPGSTVIATNEIISESAGARVHERQIEHSLRKLQQQKSSKSNKTQTEIQRRQMDSPAYPQPISPQDIKPLPNPVGGLRGLAARATASLDRTLPSQRAGKVSSGEHGPVTQPEDGAAGTTTTTARTSGNSLAELTELLVEEARRAGIDLEQFRP